MHLIVNSVEPSAPIEHIWSDEEMESGWQTFMAARQLWCIGKNFAPGDGPALEVQESKRMAGVGVSTN
jgi:hypothetical protein